MRWHWKILLLAAFVLVGLNLAFGQPTPLQWLTGMGNLIGKDSRPDPLSLLLRPEVKKELRMTDEQTVKATAAVWKALSDALEPDQFRRLKEIELQQRDYRAFADPLVQGELRLSKDQKDDMNRILTDSDKEVDFLRKDLESAAANSERFQPLIERIKSLRKETKERCTEVLTAEQRRTWIEMVGEDFKLIEQRIELPNLDKFLDPKTKKKGKKGD